MSVALPPHLGIVSLTSSPVIGNERMLVRYSTILWCMRGMRYASTYIRLHPALWTAHVGGIGWPTRAPLLSSKSNAIVFEGLVALQQDVKPWKFLLKLARMRCAV